MPKPTQTMATRQELKPLLTTPTFKTLERMPRQIKEMVVS
jgi:hypothetical protein